MAFLAVILVHLLHCCPVFHPFHFSIPVQCSTCRLSSSPPSTFHFCPVSPLSSFHLCPLLHFVYFSTFINFSPGPVFHPCPLFHPIQFFTLSSFPPHSVFHSYPVFHLIPLLSIKTLFNTHVHVSALSTFPPLSSFPSLSSFASNQ